MGSQKGLSMIINGLVASTTPMLRCVLELFKATAVMTSAERVTMLNSFEAKPVANSSRWDGHSERRTGCGGFFTGSLVDSGSRRFTILGSSATLPPH